MTDTALFDGVVVTLTRFHVPADEPFQDFTTEVGKAWQSGMMGFLLAPGRASIWWARLDNLPEKALLITVWQRESALLEFEGTVDASYSRYIKTISQHGEPVQRRAEFGNQWVRLRFENYLAITTYFIPVPLSDAQREAIKKSYGMVYLGVAVGFSSPLPDNWPYRLSPKKGIVEDVQSWQGMEVEAVIFAHFWTSEELRYSFMKEKSAMLSHLEEAVQLDGTVQVVSTLDGYITQEERFEQQLIDMGVMGREEDVGTFKKLTQWG